MASCDRELLLCTRTVRVNIDVGIHRRRYNMEEVAPTAKCLVVLAVQRQLKKRTMSTRTVTVFLLLAPVPMHAQPVLRHSSLPPACVLTQRTRRRQQPAGC